MVHISSSATLETQRIVNPFSDRPGPVTGSVLIVRDDMANNYLLDVICEFLDLNVEHVASDEDLASVLRTSRPMAVIADLDGACQDGCHVMKVVAGHDRTLPVLLLTNDDPALLGAVDAVREIWRLTRVSTIMPSANVGAVVDFLCHAARDAGLSRMMRL